MTTSRSDNAHAFDRAEEKAALEQEIGKSRRAVLVVNTRSRRGARFYSEAKRRLQEAGLTLVATYPVRHAERVPEIVRGEIAWGHRYIIIGGGDGTISSVVDHFAYASVVFGVLPLGTANSFARTIGVPVDLYGAVDVLVNGKVADVDLGKINDDYFANGSAIGLPATIAKAIPHSLKRWLGRVSYALVAANKLVRHNPFHCTIIINGEEKAFDTLDIAIAIGGHQGGVLVASEANIDDGEVVIQVLKGTSKRAFLKKWAGIALGTSFGRENIEVLTGCDLLIDASPKQDVSIDGEVVAQTPIQVSVAREALLLMVPRSFEDHDDENQP